MPTREQPSQRYTELLNHYKKMHSEGLPDQGISSEKIYDGASLLRHLATIKKMVQNTQAKSILDYGSGKGAYYKMQDIEMPKGKPISNIKDFLGVECIECYDPAVPDFWKLPTKKTDGVISTDALEHCPQEDMHWIVDEMFKFSSKFVFANVASYPARKLLPSGENAHATQCSADWWRELLTETAKNYPNVVYRFEITEISKSLRTLYKSRRQITVLTNN